jgi:hypothetical protein
MRQWLRWNMRINARENTYLWRMRETWSWKKQVAEHTTRCGQWWPCSPLSMWEFNSSAVPLGSIWFGDGTGTRWHIALCPPKIGVTQPVLGIRNLAWAGELQRTRPWWPRATSTLAAARGSFGPDHGASRRGGARSPPWRDWLRAARYRQAGRQPHERESRG